MEYTDSILNDIAYKKDMANKVINFFYLLGNEYKKNNNISFAYTIYKRAERIQNCLEYWEWDKYIKNKVKSLRIVSRCKDRFCPNCRTVNIVNAIIKFRHYFKAMKISGYSPYHMILTIPNIESKYLSDEINKMNIAFAKLIRWLSKPFKENDKYLGGYKERIFDVVAAVKVLELTVQESDWNYFHIHFHVIVFLDNENKDDFVECLPGDYQRKTGSYILYSKASIFIQKLWTMAYVYKDIKEFINASDNCKDNYRCVIKPIVSDKGINEVFKYCFKDYEIKNLEIFKNLYFGLYGKRIRQTYGSLYNVKLDDKDLNEENLIPDDIKNYLEFKDEIPVVVANNFKDNFEKDKDYKKISIYKEKLKV
jgi:plasmid rolling circle replication initiator protein Rep